MVACLGSPPAGGRSLYLLYKLINGLQYSTDCTVVSYCRQCRPARTVTLSAVGLTVHVYYTCGTRVGAGAVRSVRYSS